MLKFENLDVIATLEAIMQQNTAFYQSDFQIDRQIIQEAAVSDDTVDRYLLWMSRPSGTWCFRERETFIRGTREHNTWKFYGEQTHDRILAYAVELTATLGSAVMGTLYELDYQRHYLYVKSAALLSRVNRLTYQRGTREISPDAPFDAYPDPEYGALMRYDLLPQNPAALDSLLHQQKNDRAWRAVPGDIAAHIAALHERRMEAEALYSKAGKRTPHQSYSMTSQLVLSGWKI